MTEEMFKNGKIYKLTPKEIESIHYIYGKNGNEKINKALTRIEKEWGIAPDFLFNCELFNFKSRKPGSSVVEKGKIHFMTEGHGISFVENRQPVWSYKNSVNAPDYVGVYPMLFQNGKQDITAIPFGLQGSRGRTAIAVDNDGDFYIALVKDGTNDATLPELAEGLLKAGAYNGGNLDGGGSSQWVCPDGSHNTGRPVRGFIGVWLKKEGIFEDIRTVKVNSVLNIRKNPSKISMKVGFLRNDDTVVVLEEKNGWCRISLGWVSAQYLIKEGAV